MPLTNPNKVVTEERLNEYHKMILPYLGGNSMVACGGGYAPIGTVISYMGTRAPSDFLICDGTVYNITDYTELADFFEAQFGSNNFFGGDGNTTFAVPDLRGEFLRGTGTNSHANQGSGENVGVHQDGTEHNLILPNYNNKVMDITGSNSATEQGYLHPVNVDTKLRGARKTVEISNLTVNSQLTENYPKAYTSRPTNTSVLYCIKAKSQGNGYSLDEQIVGTWIDGKPIYQKTLTGLSLTTGSLSWTSSIADIPNGYSVISIKCYENQSGKIVDYTGHVSEAAISPTGGSRSLAIRWNYNDVTRDIHVITIQYTKTTD